MDGWSTRLGGMAMDSIISISRDMNKMSKNTPTLRDQFAMSCMQSLLANYTFETKEEFATTCYQYADAMLEARKGKSEEI